MERINDMLHFLNYLYFVADLRSNEFSNIIHTKKSFER